MSATLFEQPADQVCRSCHADSRARCEHDRDVREGVKRATTKRPKGCLNRPDPARDPFPAGY